MAIFDCDHVPVRSFLQLTAGWFLRDPRLALVQTPHHFFSPDPFERNLGVFRRMPNEGELFYGLVQDGNDLWNAAFFCGSCAVIKREPLLEIGGIRHIVRRSKMLDLLTAGLEALHRREVSQHGECARHLAQGCIQCW